ncbi:MAG: bifunctional histidinol-phosphatase/imidazoleglycerol-phosphate dehydratase HisB [Rhodanobacteraceae bacterium]|nr:bifunctional histidinol-phosphatase/imidazoleglycerol-phosphate dehydratase HisB [Rhodanobacteraceae bacterium]MBK7042391.1 bifunctional histidinol-phosphatase/imidazoleglycerol-phosphate dehydratase HisB [Rhodanobacteraceae bacterium]MBP9153661.1 bifunctional histidinol-phosphatase/imidazoleglycerol-phosphate dehydratase HisB [Xanthomonadales bacterium]HQW81994.1 bifunctional histidinol-phosphatase/imidazoleglycerol-phosphate dehydratase HisB [Pseudomonadota bacterium]
MSLRKILFLDRDGTLIEEPADFQIDSLAKLRLVPGVIPGLLKLKAAGYEFVMVSNQDGLGTDSFPIADFEPPQRLLLDILASQGIQFSAIHIDPHFEHENAATRKPGIGMLLDYLRSGTLDFAHSAVIGDRETDLQLAHNLGVRGFRVGPEHDDWATIAHRIADTPRIAAVERVTSETRIRVQVDLDREARAEVATGIGFFDHMLEQIGRHGGFALTLTCAGDTHIDEHHSIEDSALALGEALRKALGDKRGIGRYGFTLPMDETLASATLDLSGRAFFVFEGAFPRSEVGGMATELVPHFFRSLCDALGANLHLSVRGDNTHHMVEACFKVVARALRQAIRRDGDAIPSTKGAL